jgi:drug/metabolite transporter (DMT)-like permease
MSWLTLTIIAQLLNSIVALIDKYLVTSKRVATPLLYVFYTGVLTFLGILVFVPSLLIQNSNLPSFSNVTSLSFYTFTLISITVIFQLFALWTLFNALKKNDASDVMPVVGSMSAISALIIGFVLFQNTLSAHFTIGFLLLVIGTLFISHFKFSKKVFSFVVISGIFFAIYSILLKFSLSLVGFETGFFWLSLLMSIYSSFLLFSPQIRRAIKSQKGEKHVKKTGALVLINKIIAGIAGIFLIKAIEIGEVSMVQALGGLQFLFLFIFALILGPYTSIDFGETYNRKDVYQKLFAISIIFIGFVLLFI